MALLKNFTLIALLFAAYFTGFRDKPTTSINVLDAISLGIIKMDAKSNGSYSGACLNISIQNLKSERITIIIQPGTIFCPEDTSMQEIIVVKEYLLVLQKNELKKSLLNGFCSNAPKRTPKEGINLKPKISRNDNLLQISAFINKNSFNDDAIQSAIWCISDGNLLSEIYDENPEKLMPLRAEISRITGQPMVWYFTNTNRTINESGYINSLPTLVTGEISIKVAMAGILKQEVFNESGQLLYRAKDMQVPGAGNLIYDFQLTVTGWPKGKYYVKAGILGQLILKQDFII
jgi:hypothetical protein